MRAESTAVPQCKDSEKIVLGCLMGGYDAKGAIDTLTEDDFYHLEHKEIFAAAKSLADANRDIDSTSLFITIKNLRGGWKSQDEGSYILNLLTNIASGVGVGINLQDYVEILKEFSCRRAIVKECLQSATTAAASSCRVNEVLEETQKRVCKIVSPQCENSVTADEMFLGYADALRDEIIDIQNDRARGIFKTGWLELDGLLGGFKKGSFIVVGARPAMGKTALALNIATHFSKRGNHVFFYSLEMPVGQIKDRIMSSEAGIPVEKIFRREVDDNDLIRMKSREAGLRTLAFVCSDKSGSQLQDIKSGARRAKGKNKLDILIVDYIQLIATADKAENRQEFISTVSRQLKMLAVELDIVVIGLSQLSRKVEERQDKRPMASDLRESGSLEQDADAVVMLYREEVYDKFSAPGLAQLIVVKNRHGRTGIARLEFESEYGRFKNFQLGA